MGVGLALLVHIGFAEGPFAFEMRLIDRVCRGALWVEIAVGPNAQAKTLVAGRIGYRNFNLCTERILDPAAVAFLELLDIRVFPLLELHRHAELVHYNIN